MILIIEEKDLHMDQIEYIKTHSFEDFFNLYKACPETISVTQISKIIDIIAYYNGSTYLIFKSKTSKPGEIMNGIDFNYLISNNSNKTIGSN